MEDESVDVLHDRKDNMTMNEVTESNRSEIDMKDVSEPSLSSLRNNKQVKMINWKGGGIVSEGGLLKVVDISGEVNMEASITPDDVIRAGGFGARDDISSFLPVASDLTDFEASIRDAHGYEEPQGEVRRQVLAGQKHQKQSSWVFTALHK